MNFKFGTFIGRFPSDGTSSMAVKVLKRWRTYRMIKEDRPNLTSDGLNSGTGGLVGRAGVGGKDAQTGPETTAFEDKREPSLNGTKMLKLFTSPDCALPPPATNADWPRSRSIDHGSCTVSSHRVHELCEIRGGCPSPYGICGRKATLNWTERSVEAFAYPNANSTQVTRKHFSSAHNYNVLKSEMIRDCRTIF